MGPRPALLAGFAVLLLAILAGFAYVVSDSESTWQRAQDRSRHEAELRFADQATISAELTGSIFTASAGSAQAAAAAAFGQPTVDTAKLNALVKSAKLAYGVVLDDKGRVLARSDAMAADDIARMPSAGHVKEALAGRPALSDMVQVPSGWVVEWALPFDTPSGRRVEVQGVRAKPLADFFSGYLARGRASDTERYILDSQNRIVGAVAVAGKPGDRLQNQGLLAGLGSATSNTYGAGRSSRYFTSSPVPGASWRVVLTEPESSLYPARAGSRSALLYLVLAAFAVAGLVCLILLRRALITGARLGEANRELADVNETLEARVLERTAAADDRAKELARSNAELEQFASITSHDLQEPLRKIRMFGDRVHTAIGDDIPDQAKEDLLRMQNAAERMQRLISDLLSFSRVSSRGREYEPVDLGEVTREVIADLEPRVVALDAILDVGSLPVIEADTTQMRQLLQNLLSNALKFHRDGEPPRISIRGDVIPGREPRFAGEARGGDRAIITVQDNGIGFDQKYAERVFAAFERLHGRSAYEGTGIGLSIARKIVWRHGGEISVISIPDAGSTFTVTLPLTHEAGDVNGTDTGGLQ
jgi:signal transduction histidine kinase